MKMNTNAMNNSNIGDIWGFLGAILEIAAVLSPDENKTTTTTKEVYLPDMDDIKANKLQEEARYIKMLADEKELEIQERRFELSQKMKNSDK